MERTWRPTAAGWLCTITGAIGVPVSILISLAITVVTGEPGGSGELPIPLAVAVWIVPVALAIVAIVGGTYALRRRRWGLALAGSVCALPFAMVVGYPGGALLSVILHMLSGWTLWVLSSVVFGIPWILTLVFIIRGRREFT